MQPLVANHTHTDVVASIENLTLSLSRDGIRSAVLRGVDLTITRGEIVGLAGESGSGKSVLGLTLMGLLPKRSHPQLSGTVKIAGVDMIYSRARDLREVRRRELGVIFQDPMTSLNPTMRVGVQVTESAGNRDESIRLMTAVGIADAEARFAVYPHELSGGLRQRIMAAIAVAGAPSLIVADEPTTALDVTVQAQLLRLLHNLRDEFGCSILFITHDLAVAAQIADRLAVLYAGRIAEIGPTPEVLHRPTHPYTVGLLRSRLSLHTPRDGVLPTLRGDTARGATLLDGCAYHSRCPLADARCATEQPPLEPVQASTPANGLPETTSLSHDRACWRTPDEVHALDTSDADPQGQPAPPAHGAAPAPGALAVQIDNVHVRFQLKASRRGRREVHALRGIDLQVHAGQAVSIVGESGSGKSTLLRVIAGLTPPTSGTVCVGTGGAQMVFQDAGSSLTPWLTVGAVLHERLRPLKLSRAQARQRIGEALSSVGLPATVTGARPAELSGGQRQRVALARATIIAPAVLLCDEPTSSLDASLAASILNLIREMRSRLHMTVLFVTHDLAVARLMGDRIIVMTNGEIVESGDPQSVIDAPTHPYTQRLLSSVPELGGTR